MTNRDIQFLDCNSLEVLTPRVKFAQMIGVHRNTLRKYEKKAKIISPDYREDAETLEFLSRFQCWCLWYVWLVHKRFQNRSHPAGQYLKNHRQVFAKTKFNWEQRNPNTLNKQLIEGI